MTSTLTWAIAGGSVDGSREEIFRILQGWTDYKVIYLHGWGGLGASAVLRSIAEVLPYRRTTPELCFDKIIHIDCSDWKNRRGLQRAIAEELELESSIMAVLDKQDEFDDFQGVDESSRNEITSVSREIHNILKYSRFVLIFHNGSDNEIANLVNFGVPPITSFGDNVMIWTYRRRMLTIKKYEEDELLHELRYTHLFVYDRMGFLAPGQLYELLCKEADIIVARNPCIQGVNQLMVVHCCLYKLFLQCSVSKNNSNWVDVASNYWICDGILPKDITLETSDALHREITWKWDDNVLTKFKEHFELPFLIVKEDDVYEEGPYRWISVTSRDREMLGMKTLPAETSSFFLEFVMSDQPTMLPNGLFEHSSNLGALTLRCCAFSFASPPFLKCHNLRFLGLDHCTDDKIGEGEDHTEWVCLHSLWVLDLRYTHWNEILSPAKMDLMDNLMELSIEGVWCWQYTTCLQGRLLNLQRLRVIKPTRGPDISTDASNSLMDKAKLEILDLSGNNEMEILPNSLSKASSLQVLILDGCNDLKNVLVPDGLPQSLKSFSFDGCGPAFRRAPIVELPPKQERPSTPATKEGASVSNISLKGCSQLAHMFVRGLPNLVELDLSGTTIRTLDFSTMVLEVPMLKRLFLLGCEHLRAIIWGRNTDSFRLKLLCIDTRAGTSFHRPCINQNEAIWLEVHAIVVDARLARSLRQLLYNRYAADENVYLNIHVTSAVYSELNQSKVTDKEKKIGMYGDQVSLPQLVQADRYSDVQSMVGDAPMQDFPKPPTNNVDRHIEIAEGRHALDSGLGYLMTWFAESLHVHDVLTSACLPNGYSWLVLKQCRMERCPKLGEVFPLGIYELKELETFWASDLLMACWIRSKGYRMINDGSFRKLQHLRLRSCPRLQFVLPVWVDSFPSLETLHIIHCGDLRHVFVLNDKWYPEEISIQVVAFPKLTTIHLHDLPVLQQICEVKMVAPNLKTIKIRGCWGLRRLPVVGPRSRDMKKPTVEIEKDVWDALEWDGGAAPGHFEAPVHSRYYKKKLPRVSVLR
ncbi:hypothetical protein CFC21_111485 [Triticum aestivum]|uniref:NB-ARC domain-containing protein n=2 Tax=Triticum aestivum TaxID=4565 RepID=A0A9R1NF50_WHEAT|nr:uncharacterized protein LOC123170092 [Triticum aestivum]KAF7111475.1 hypothetical protein CFC21_111485 [Triticum aestivum]